jgi:hypothetical protein
MCFYKKNSNTEKTKFIKKSKMSSNYEIFKKYNSTEIESRSLCNNYEKYKSNPKLDILVELHSSSIKGLILAIEKYFNNWYNFSDFKVIGSYEKNNILYYILSDNITKQQIKVKYSLIDDIPIKTIIVHEVIYSV